MAESEGFKFQFDWRVTALVVLLLPLLVSLGFWQLDRAQEKRQLLAQFAQKQAAGPVPIETLSTRGDLRYQPVSLQGAFIPGKNLLLDNRIHRGRFGYEVVTPFRLRGKDLIVLVNRGWVPGDTSRRTLPAVQTVTGTVRLSGEIYVPQGKLMRLGDDRAQGWPRVVQSVDIDRLRKIFGHPLFPYTVHLKADSPAAFQPNWTVVNLTPARHIAYAVQWFAMAATVVIIAFLGNTNAWALFKGRRRS